MKTALLKWSSFHETIAFDGTESDLWKQIGQKLLTCKVPETLKITIGEHEGAYLEINERGTFLKDGEWVPSMYVVSKYNNIRTEPSQYEEVYLKCVNPEGNDYKYYKMMPKMIGGEYRIDVEWGSIDADTCAPRRIRQPYESYLFWIRYYEKLSKGYKDYSEIQLRSKSLTENAKTCTNMTAPITTDGILYQELMDYAHKIVHDSLMDPENITIAQVREARKEFNKMCKMKTYRGFETHLVNLMALSPRNTGNRTLGASLKDLLPQEYKGDKALQQEEFSKIIDREETLLLSMEAIAGLADASELQQTYAGFAQYNITVTEASRDEITHIKSLLDRTQAHLVKTVYKVIPHKQQQLFDSYCQKYNINNIKELWHGSVNANWASIIQNSLRMGSAAHGRMFGDGYYFAPSSDKSWGYTSYHYSRWAGGNSDVAFMGLYKVAYGKPLMAKGYGCYYNEQSVRDQGFDCVHAIAKNTGLRADEIIVYNDAAVCLEYLVKFTG